LTLDELSGKDFEAFLNEYEKRKRKTKVYKTTKRAVERLKGKFNL